MNRTGGRLRLALVTAIVGTVFIAAGAFWLSFTSLADLARRSGLSKEQAWAWPLIVDGIIVVATVAVVVLSGTHAAWYPWMLLFAGAFISVAGNAIHAVVAATPDVPLALAASVAAIPPLVLLAITHLTSILARHAAGSAALTRGRGTVRLPGEVSDQAIDLRVVAEPTPRALGKGGPDDAAKLRASGMSNRAIAQRIGVHPSTIGRWLRDPVAVVDPRSELTERS